MRSILPLATPHVVHSNEEFEEIVGSSPLPVLVDFWAPWCGPCQMVASEVDRVARARAGGTVVVTVNTDEVPALAQRYAIEAIPTFIVFRDGHEARRVTGATVAQTLIDLTSAA
jgi:thioredoxin 2